METHAIQVQRKSPPQDPEGQIPGDELAGIRCRAGATRQSHRLVGRRSVIGMARTGDRKAGWSGGLRDIAIENGLALRLVLHQPLRQTEGALRSIADLLGVQIRIPDHTMFSRRGGGLKVLPQRVERNEPPHLLIDSTGVKIYGEGEWLDQKHGVRSRRRWRKLRLAVDADTHVIAAVEQTPDDVGDVSTLPDLLDQIEEPVGSVTADGAYDGGAIYDEVLQRHPAARVIIPPRSTAILGDAGTTQRDDHLRSIKQHGRLGWQRRPDMAGAVWSRRQCIDIRPSSAGAFVPGACSING
jgi:hypothetical protein